MIPVVRDARRGDELSDELSDRWLSVERFLDTVFELFATVQCPEREKKWGG
jgi:hypothetical protein